MVLMVTRALEVELISRVMDVPLNELAECLRNNNLSAEDVENLENMFNEDQTSREYSSNFGCFVTCVFEKSNIIQNNEIQLDRLIALAKRNKFNITAAIKQKLNECINEAEEEDDKCKIGLVFTSCVMRKLRQ
nr:PREDICTED: uncharacterized protein LOC105664041 [Megachile rotundata]